MHTANILGHSLRIGLAMALCAPLFADEVDDYVETQRQWLHIPGLSIAVVQNSKIVKARGYGLANVEAGTPVTAESVFKIGSVSKQFIAAVVVLLARDGKIGLDEPASKYLEDPPASWKKITIRHLLTHTSGLVREAPGFDPFKAQTDGDFLKLAAPVPLRFGPGERWEYSNVGYYVLAEIIRKVTGKSWGECVTERLFVPAGMSSSRTITTDVIPKRASGYVLRGHKMQNAAEWIVVRPTGGFLSTVVDLAKWDMALSTDAILSAAEREQLWTAVKLKSGKSHPYGFGWFVDAAQGHRRIRHDGGLPGFSCDFERFVDDQLTVIVLSNAENRDLRDLALRVAGFYVPALLPPLEKALPDNEPKITALVKSMIQDFANNKIETNRFTAKLALELNRELNAGFGEDIQRLGSIQSIDLIERKSDGDNRIYRYRLTYRQAVLFVRCAFNKENQISEFSIFD